MILSNVEVHRALDNGRLVISPEPKPRFASLGGGHCPYDTHSVDLRLSTEVLVPKSGAFVYDLTQPGNLPELIDRNSDKFTISREQPFKLAPNKFILGKTLERVELPLPPDGDVCLAARIEGKSSRARLGLLIHFTAPTVHPGFKGTLTLEIINLGHNAIQLVPEMAIAQLIVEEVKGIPRENPSQFQGQTTASGL